MVIGESLMNLVEVVVQTKQQLSDSHVIPLSKTLNAILAALSASCHIRVCTYDSISAPTGKSIKLYYFDKPAQLTSSKFYEHVKKYSTQICDRSVALLNFRIQGLCPVSATHFNDLVILDSDLDDSIRLIRTAITNITQPKKQATNKSIVGAFFSLSFVGKSPQYHKLVTNVSRMAKCRAPVLIEGETGTGKELLARALHYLSDAKSNAFVPINCAAIPDNLLESELFGHEKGAFTHAQQKNQGLIELAEGGTLFLDEVDSLSAKAQTALLRFLQSGEVRAVGSCKYRQVNVRIVAASNTPLAHEVKLQSFREDLFFRLNVLKLQVPPLRERVADIEILVQHMLLRFEQQYGKYPRLLHPDLLSWLKKQHWPGNVRELENYLLQRYLLSDATILGIEDDQTAQMDGAGTRPECLTEMSFQQAKDMVVDDFAESYIAALLTKTSGNVTRAAELAGKERRAFGKLMKKYHIDASNFQAN
jgi:DNA-binding NtrC family response regulator